MEDEFDLLAGLLLESRNDLPDRLVLLRVVAFVPPDDEIGGLGPERCHSEHRGKNRSSAAHVVTSPIGAHRQYLLASGAWQCSRQTDLEGGAGQWDFGKVGLGSRTGRSRCPAAEGAGRGLVAVMCGQAPGVRPWDRTGRELGIDRGAGFSGEDPWQGSIDPTASRSSARSPRSSSLARPCMVWRSGTTYAAI